MSESAQSDHRDDKEFLALVARYLDQVTTPDEEEKLAEELRQSESRRLQFVEYCRHAAMLKELLSEQESVSDLTNLEHDSLLIPPLSTEHTPEGGMSGTWDDRTSLGGLFGGVFQSGLNFLSRPFILTLLLTVGLPCLLLVVLWVHIESQPIPTSPVARQTAPQRLPVGKVVRTHGCRWEESAVALSAGMRLSPGQQVRVREGLVEIEMTNGTSLVLEGPITLDFRSPKRVKLNAGMLAAAVPKRAIGFTVETPEAVVVDLGTEFGVAVGNKGASEVQVFKAVVRWEDGTPTCNSWTATSGISGSSSGCTYTMTGVSGSSQTLTVNTSAYGSYTISVTQ